MTAPREFSDELPPILRAWWDWTERSLAGWSYAWQVTGWALRSIFLPVMACGLTVMALVVIWPLACLGQMWHGLRVFSQPKADVVPFAARRRG